jgi:two-component system phosphate regulon response regulator PhoB
MQKVLLVEDDFTMVTLLKTLLGIEGYQVETLLEKAGDPIENLRREHADVLLIDIHLGARSGLDLVREIRRQPDLKQIRIVMMSGIDKGQECLAAGADAFLLKPFMPEDLYRALQLKE